MLKRLWNSFRAALFGATSEDWSDAKPLPYMLRCVHGSRDAEPVKLRRCSCGLLHDRVASELCYGCADKEAAKRPKVLPLRRVAGR